MNPKWVHINFARDPVPFILQWSLNKLPLLLLFISFSIHYLTKKPGSRAKTETKQNKKKKKKKKKTHTIARSFPLTGEQRHWHHNVAIVQSYWREQWLILTSHNDHVTSHESIYLLKYGKHYVPIGTYWCFCFFFCLFFFFVVVVFVLFFCCCFLFCFSINALRM